MKRTFVTVLAGLALCLSASATIVAQWNFNDVPGDGDATTGTYLPAIGSGLAGPVGGLTSTFQSTPGSSDPILTDPNNSCWRLTTWPAQGTGNKTRGAQFALNTSGYQDLTMTWDQLDTGVASRYWRIQYSIDNGATWVDKDVIVNTLAGDWTNGIATVSFLTVPGANNSTNFMVRLMSEFQSTATGGGTVGYATVNPTATYATSSILKLDMVAFNGTTASGDVNIVTDPTSQVVAVGQPASFSVVAGGGTTPITYQWRKNSSPIADATNSVYAIAAAQHADAAPYDVIVANGVNSQTSAVATLAVRDPLNLAWTGLNGATWDTTTVSWTNDTLANVAYTGGDHVLFDSLGASAPTVSLVGSINPSSITVDADFDYVLRSDVGGQIVGASGLTKRGAGTLTLDTDNSYTGPTVIQAGVVQLGAADAHGSTGSGPITNNSALVFNRTSTVIVTNTITGSGSLTNLGGTVTLSGANIYNGPIAAKAGSLILAGNQTVNSTDVIVTASAATGPTGATKFGLSGGLVIGSGTTLHLSGSTAAPDCRCTLLSTFGSNSFNGPIVLDGSGNNGFTAEGVGTQLHVNGNVSGANFSGSITLRGASGSGVLSGTINLPNNVVHKTDSGTWTVNSTGNEWIFTTLASGTLRLGANNALPTGLTLQVGAANNTATLDLGGFNQQIANITDTGGTEIIGNSSVTSDSTLTVGSGQFSGTIQDKIGSVGTRKTSLILNGTAFTLAGANTYSGDTTVAAGVLSLSGIGDIPNSPVIDLAGGALDVSTRFDASLPLYSGQTLKGNGTLSITGNLGLSGTVELKVNKAGGIVSNDKLVISGQLFSGGTLKLVLTGQPLNWKDTIPVFAAAGGYVGGVPTIDPAVPAPGATWDTSTLVTDGMLRIHGPATFTSTIVSGGNITLSGVGGEVSGTFSVLTSTNVAAAALDWTPLQTGLFDASGNFSVILPVTPGQPRRFYKLQMP